MCRPCPEAKHEHPAGASREAERSAASSARSYVSQMAQTQRLHASEGSTDDTFGNFVTTFVYTRLASVGVENIAMYHLNMPPRQVFQQTVRSLPGL